jgi:hypothetical protein
MKRSFKSFKVRHSVGVLSQDEFFDPAQAELQNVRQVKLKKSLKRLRELERREQKQRDERARREKERIRNSMKSLEQHK